MALAEVAELVHKCLPNPTVLLIEASSCACVSVALTRKSQAEQGATVIDRIETTGAFDPSRPEYADFLDAMAFERLSQDDLWEYLLDLSRTVTLSRAIDGLGFYPKCPRTKPGNANRPYVALRRIGSLRQATKGTAAV